MKKEQQTQQPLKEEFQSTLNRYLSTKAAQKIKYSQQWERKKQQHTEVKHDQNHKRFQKSQKQLLTVKQRSPKPVKQKPAHNISQNHRKESINKSHTEQLSSLSARSNSPEVIVQKKNPPKNVNVLFYLNRIASQPNGEYIDKMHLRWFSDYQKLQRDHSFIQWIFPNSFQSRFNIHALPLSSDQAQEFRTNPEIAKRYLESYDMMLAFYGMRMKDRHTGELMRNRNPDFKERMHKTLLTSFHNHMRITRILCSLTETGFGMYAAELCKFLKQEIYDKNGFMNSLQRYGVYKDWKPFQVYIESKNTRNVYLQKINKRREQPKNVHLQKRKEQLQKKKQQLKVLFAQSSLQEPENVEKECQNLRQKEDSGIYANPARQALQ